MLSLQTNAAWRQIRLTNDLERLQGKRHSDLVTASHHCAVTRVGRGAHGIDEGRL